MTGIIRGAVMGVVLNLVSCGLELDPFCDVARCAPGDVCDAEAEECRPAPAAVLERDARAHVFEAGEARSRCGAADRRDAHTPSSDARPCPACHAGD